MLSGWEPCIEPCHLKTEFERDFLWDIKLSASDLIDVNLTKIFLHLVQDVKDKWCREPSNVQVSALSHFLVSFFEHFIHIFRYENHLYLLLCEIDLAFD